MALKATMEKQIETHAPELLGHYKSFKVSMEKEGLEEITAEVLVGLDFSWSTEGDHWGRHFYSSGIMQLGVKRFMPVALGLDDNARLDGLVFSSFAHYCGDIGIDDPAWNEAVNTWTKAYLRESGESRQGGTNLLSAIQRVIQLYTERHLVADGGWMEPGKQERRRWGRKANDEFVLPRLVRPAAVPMVAYIWTDGEPDPGTEDAIITLLEASCYLPIFFKFIGLGDERFEFLNSLNKRLNSEIDHVGFSRIRDVKTISDEDLYNRVVLGEFARPDEPGQVPWITKAADHEIIVPMAA